MDTNILEFYKNEEKVITFDMFINNVAFEPDTTTIDVYINDILIYHGNCTVTSNQISFLLPIDVSGAVGKYKGIFTLIKGSETHIKKITIDVRDI